MPREFTRIGVVGLGTMGAGIAEVFARNGFSVIGLEQSDELVERGRSIVVKSTDRAVARGRLEAADQQTMLERLAFTTATADLADCDLIVEAVLERMDLKHAVFADLDAVVAADALLATNTSSLSVTEIAAATAHPERVVGMHFFNPAPVQRLVEVIATVVADPDVVAEVVDLARRLGKSPVQVGDQAGFIANALLFGYLNDAMTMAEQGHATRDDIDLAMQVGCGFPMGPFALLDLIGLDTALQVLETLYGETRSRRHVAGPLLRRMVTAGLLGRKTGRGFADYPPPHNPADGEADDGVAAEVEDASPRLVTLAGDGPVADALADLLATTDVSMTRMPTGSALGNSEPDVVLVAVGADESLLDLARSTGRPAHAVGVHLVAPTPEAVVAEIVRTIDTEQSTVGRARAVLQAAGVSAVVSRDRAGRIVDALVHPYLNDAVRMVEHGYASRADIDTAMRLGCALPLGPFEMLEAIGPSTVLAGLERRYAETREPSFAPTPLLAQLARVG